MAITSVLAVSACSVGGDASPTVAATSATAVRDLNSYDAFVLASAENNPLYADVYGLRLDPASADRITTMKRVSSLGADQERIIVAAADGDVDRLALVQADGALVTVPGLGRPYAFNPVLRGGSVYYEVAGKGGITRSFAFDFSKQQRVRLSESTTLSGGVPIGRSTFVHARAPEKLDGALDVVIRSPAGDRELSFGAPVFGFEVGKQWVAATASAPGSSYGQKPEAVILLDLQTGKPRRVEGLQAVCWSPDGTKLLARRVGDPLSSPLVLLDPAEPDAPVELGAVPGLTIYSGAWVRGGPPA